MIVAGPCISTQRISSTDCNGNLEGYNMAGNSGTLSLTDVLLLRMFLGTDDPDKVQEALSTWDKFDEGS